MSNPEHRITLTPAANRWRARFNGHVVADTADAVILQETGFPPRVYFPRADVGMDYLSRTDAKTHCPFKGDAAYYSIHMDGRFEENAVWTYEAPKPGVSAIANLVSFYPEKVEVYEVDDARVNPRHEDGPPVDQTVLHTDAGDGRSQREHWAPTAENPDLEGGVR